MIYPVDKTNRSQFESACTHERVFGSKCLNSLQCYGENHPEARFFVGLTPSGEGSAALYLSDGVLVISSDNRLPAGELADFVRQHSVQEIDTNLEQCEALQQLLGGRTESSFYMEYRGEPPQGDFSGIVPCERLEEVFSVLQQSHEYYREHLTLERWAPDIQLRREHGLLELFQLDLDGKPVGTGCIVSQDEECGVIAAVAVTPEYRHRGLGGLISRFLTARILAAGKTPRLISGYDAVAELYRQVGYTALGRWGELYL